MNHRNFSIGLVIAFCLIAITSSLSVMAESDPPGLIVSSRGQHASLLEAIQQAEEGDTIEVFGGVHAGPLVVDKTLELIGHDWPVIDGNGVGTVLKLTAPDTIVRGFRIINSGDSLDEENSGISGEATGLKIEGNRLENTLFGIYLRDASGSTLKRNHIQSKKLDVPRRGDPIRVWYSHEAEIISNEVEKGRDVVLWYSENLTVSGNTVRDGRYGLHFMYCDDALIKGNLLINNSVGAFLMYSRRLRLENNTIAFNHGPSGYGVGLKDMDDALISQNLFFGNRIGAHLDNSPREVDSIGQFEGNVFAFNDIGVNLMPSVRNNQFTRNSFIDNQEQVGISGNGAQAKANSWDMEGTGNYWSDYAGFDVHDDGIGDIPYLSEKLYENLIGRHPGMRLFIYSPASDAINFAAEAVPLVKPDTKLIDEKPMMEPELVKGAPALPRSGSNGLAIASVIMFAVAIGIIAIPKITRTR